MAAKRNTETVHATYVWIFGVDVYYNIPPMIGEMASYFYMVSFIISKISLVFDDRTKCVNMNCWEMTNLKKRQPKKNYILNERPLDQRPEILLEGGAGGDGGKNQVLKMHFFFQTTF